MSRAKKIICFVLLGSGLIAAILHRGGESGFKDHFSEGGTSPPVQGDPFGQGESRNPSRSRKIEPSPSDKEVWNFLRGAIIHKLELDDVTVAEALEVLNEALQEIPSARKRPTIKAMPDLLADPRRIRELRVTDIPTSVALKSICDQSKCRAWAYKGTVFVDMFHPDGDDLEPLLRETKLDGFTIPAGNLSDALGALQAALEEVDFFGIKPSIMFVGDGSLRTAVVRGEVGKPLQEGHLRNTTVRDALDEICRRAGARYEYFEGEIHIKLDGWVEPSDRPVED